MNDAPAAGPGRLKKVLFGAFTLLLPFAVVECGLRGYFATQVGPSVWLFGTPLHGREIIPPDVTKART